MKSGDLIIASTTRAMRMLETASPPTFYLPIDDVERTLLQPAPGRSMCEWKGQASYFSIVIGGRRIERSAWTYESPFAPYEAIAGAVCFYPSRFDCFVDGEAVQPQAGDFYGGWITSDVVGPFKGDPGTQGW